MWTDISYFSKTNSDTLQVMDEADRILNMDFEAEVDKILKTIPRERRTYLYSATMTKKVQKLQRASLKDPVKVEVSSKYQTVDKLQQFYVFIPVKYKVGLFISMQNLLIRSCLSHKLLYGDNTKICLQSNVPLLIRIVNQNSILL